MELVRHLKEREALELTRLTVMFKRLLKEMHENKSSKVSGGVTSYVATSCPDMLLKVLCCIEDSQARQCIMYY